MLHHINHRTLYLRVDAGIGNRIVPILFGLRLVHQEYFDNIIIQWQNSNCSQFEFTDLFDIISDRIEIVGQSELSYITKWLWCGHLSGRFGTIIPMRYLPPNSNCYGGYAPIITQNDTKLPLETIKNEVTAIYPNYIKPKYHDIIDQTNITNDYIGIHCRRTDAYNYRRIKYDTEIIDKISRAHDIATIIALQEIIEPSDKLFVASDNQKTKEYYKSHLNNVTTLNLHNYPILLYSIKQHFNNVYPWVHTYRSKESIIESFIELLILSKCKMIITDYPSSYVSMAEYLFGTPIYQLKRPAPVLSAQQHQPLTI